MLNAKEHKDVVKWMVTGADWDNKRAREFLMELDDKNGTDKILCEMMKDGVEFDDELASELALRHDDP